MGLVSREVPFGENERGGKRSLYEITDPFVRCWYRVVAPQRGMLQTAPRNARKALLIRHWASLRGQAWEQLCRIMLTHGTRSDLRGPWRSVTRYWHGSEPEWDLVSLSDAASSLLLGECKAKNRPFKISELAQEAELIASKPFPRALIPGGSRLVRALFVPEVTPNAPKEIHGVKVCTLKDWFR